MLVRRGRIGSQRIAETRALAVAAARQSRRLVGIFLEPPAAIMILTPLLLPVMVAAGVNPIHFGIIMAVNLSIGMYTPPFGLNLFASQAIFNQPLATIYRGVVPFVLINFATLLLISYVPWFSLGLLGLGR
jgi:C4-dicarboxylate transporter DctM subunit